jgi:transketolase C-terminal domain/subunit
MRTAFIETLCELAEQDERIWLLTGDLGYSVLERFSQRFPKRYINMGVAEQNMTGVAAGLALESKIVFTVWSKFATMCVITISTSKLWQWGAEWHMVRRVTLTMPLKTWR